MSHTRFGFQARNTPAERRAFFDLIRNDHRTGREMGVVLEAIEALPQGITQILAPTGNVSVGTSFTALTTAASVTFTAGRIWKVKAYVRAISASAAETAEMSVFDGSTNLASVSGVGGHAHFTVSPPYGGSYAEWRFPGDGTTYANFNIKGKMTSTTQTWHGLPNSDFYIEDMGAA